MESALFAGQIGVAGLSLAAFSTTLDIIHAIRIALDLCAQTCGVDSDAAYFKTQLLLQKDILDSWQRDWLGYRVNGDAPSLGRLRILKAHEKTTTTTLQSVKIELDRLMHIATLRQGAKPTSAANRAQWVIQDKAEAETALARVESLLRGLCLILPLNSPHHTATVLITLPQGDEDQVSRISGALGGEETEHFVQRTIALRSFQKTLDQDLEKRIVDFQQNIQGEDLSGYPVPANLEDEYGTAGGRSWGQDDGNSVMVEWKPYRVLQGQDAIRLAGRNDILAKMLHALPKPDELRILHCKGYFDDVANRKYGFVFEFPASNSEGSITLNKLLNKPPPERLPSLRQRYHLAYQISLTLLILLTTGWLHKGIRSHNILFVHNNDDVQWGSPFLCGFAYARPDKPDELSEKLEHSERFNVYRHPLAQGQPREGYRKAFDIYSVGVLLFEIATWRPAFLLWTHDAAHFRTELCKPSNKSRIAHSMGVDYRDAMLRCLDGSFDGDDISTPRAFLLEVVDVLRQHCASDGGW